MPSWQAQYDPVSDDGYESKACFSEEDFRNGIEFSAKMVGKLEVPRPNNRSEIVGAMRKIRYEFKARGIEKRRVIISVSVDGLSVILRKRKNRIQWWRESKALLLQHPVHRVFYVSHDSQDLKVFSYIARDTTTNLFICVVFKAYRHNQAMRIVGTIGQAFEVCHKLNRSAPPESAPNTPNTGSKLDSGESETYRFTSAESDGAYMAPVSSSNESQTTHVTSLNSGAGTSGLKVIEESSSTDHDTLTDAKTEQTLLSKLRSTGSRSSTPSHSALKSPPPPPTLPQLPGAMPLGFHHIQLMRQQLEQHNQQAQVAIAQVQLLKDKLTAETAARVEAQTRIHQLLLHNRELLDHLNQLVNRVHMLESGRDASTAALAASLASDTSFQTMPLFTREWPTLSRVFSNSCPRNYDYCSHRVPSEFSSDFSYLLSARTPTHTIFDPSASTLDTSGVDGATGGTSHVETASDANCGVGVSGSAGNISPDSGHKEMSSDSLAQQMYRLSETPGHTGAPDVLEQLPRLDPPPSTRRRPPVPARAPSDETSSIIRAAQTADR